MDPIAAWKAQQERLGSKEKTVEELRTGYARWAGAFDMFDKDSDGMVSQEQSVQAFKMITGGAAAEVPELKLADVFKKHAGARAETIDFRKFQKLALEVNQFMTENPTWKAQEIEAKEDAERLEARKERERKKIEESDIYNILGIKKTKEIMDMEKRKDQAVERSQSQAALKLRSAGQKVLEAQKVVKRLNISELAAMKKRATIQECTADSGSSGAKAKTSHTTSLAGNAIIERGKSIDLATDIPELQFRGFGSACFSLRYSPDGSRLAGGFFDGCVRIFDVDKMTQMHTLSLSRPGTHTHLTRLDGTEVSRSNIKPVDEPSITNLRWAPSGRQTILATVDIAGTVGIWDLTKGREPRVLSKLPSTGELSALTFSEDAGKLVLGGADKTVKVYDMSAGVLVKDGQVLGSQLSGIGRVAGHTLKVLSLCANPATPEVFISGGLDKQVLVWDLREGKGPVAQVQGTELSGDALDISRDGNMLLAGSHRCENPLQIFDLRRLSPRGASSLTVQPLLNYSWSGEPSSSRAEAGLQTMLFGAAWDWESRIIAAAGEKVGMGQVFQRPRDDDGPLKVLATVDGRGRAMYSAAVSGDGRSAAFGGVDGTLRMCDLTGR